MSTDRRKFLQSSLTLAALASGGVPAAPAAAASTSKRVRHIGTEETFATKEYLAARGRLDLDAPDPVAALDPITRKLLDLGRGRLADMDKAGIDIQLISMFSGTGTIPANIATEIMTRANDQLAAAVHTHPGRFAGLITVMPQNVDDAVKEINRGAKELKLQGAIINSTTLGEYLDEPKYLPIFEALTENDLSLYLHPATPPGAMGKMLDITGFKTAWGFGVDAGTHAVRIMAAGIFDRFPTFRLVLGHMGESLPFWIGRMDLHYRKEFAPGAKTPMKELPSYYMRKNIYVTTSGMNFWPQLKMTMDVLGADRVMFATDYPFENTKEAVDAIDRAPLSDADRDRIFHANAERVFHIPPTA